MDKQVVHNLNLVFAYNASIMNIKTPFAKIFNSYNLVTEENPKEYVDFRNKAKVLGLCPYRFGILLHLSLVPESHHVDAKRSVLAH